MADLARWTPHVETAGTFSNALSKIYGGFSDVTERHRTKKYTKKSRELELNTSRISLASSVEDLQFKKAEHRIKRDNMLIEQRHRLNELEHPEWYQDYGGVIGYQDYSQEPEQDYGGVIEYEDYSQEPAEEAHWQEGSDEQPWYKEKRWGAIALVGAAACVATKIALTASKRDERPEKSKRRAGRSHRSSHRNEGHTDRYLASRDGRRRRYDG